VRREQRASGTWSGPDRFGIFGGLAFLTVQMGNLSFAAGFFSLLAAVTIVSLILIWAARMSIRGKSTLRREVDSYRDLLEAIPSPEPIRFPSPRQVSNDLLMQGAVLSSKGERAPPLESYGRLGRFVIRFLQKWVRFTKLETAGLAVGPVIFNTVGMEHKDYETYLSTIRSGVEAGMPYAVLLVDELNKAELERAIATFVPIELQGRIFIIPSSAYARISESGQDKILYFNQDALLNELAASHEDVTPSRIVSPIPVLLLGKNDLEIVLWIKGWLFPIVQNKVSGWIKTLEAIRRGIDSSA
jgi:hypothetical protein